MRSKFWFLKQIKLFSNLKDEELNDLDKITRMEEVKRRQPIYLPGDPANTVYLLKAGRVKISRVTEDGKEFTLAILEPGEVFGELEVLEGTPRDTVAEALEDISVCVIQRKDFEEVLQNNPDLTIRLTKLIGFRLKKIENRIEDLVFRDVPTRVAHLLLSLSKEFGKQNEDGVRLSVKMTHQELANLIGSTRETVSATLNDFKRQGLIQQDHQTITIRDQRRLSSIH
jgi:CRP/FNR family transcriptional regulator, cyclic AMP receptor protein